MLGVCMVKALCYEPEGHGFETRWGLSATTPT
jgi:hypothetical protein